jgi:hypothetical protein
MRQRLRSHLTYANVMVTILAFVVFGGGTAVALNGSNTVQSDDLGPGAQVKAPDVAANAVNSQDIADKSITGADVAASALPRGRAKTSSCNPKSTDFEDCGHVTLHLTRPSRVLIIASAMWFANTNAPGGTKGTCRLAVNGAPFGPNAFPGEATLNTNVFEQQSLTLTNVTDPNLGAGNHSFGLACDEDQGDIEFDPTYVSAVVLGSG